MHTHETLELTAATNAWAAYRVADRALLAFSLLTAGLLLPLWPWKIAVFCLTTAFALLWARVPARVWAKGLFAITGFSLLSALPLLWMDNAGVRAFDVLGRALSAGAAMLLLAATAPAEELLVAAHRSAWLRPFAELAILVYRFLAILRECADSVAIAWHCRAGVRSWPRFRLSVFAAASIAVRGFHRARRMEAGLSLRGSGEHLRFWAPVRETSWALRAAASGVAIGLPVGALLLGENFPWQ
jgi:cobalt/nickel transport system permease protein